MKVYFALVIVPHQISWDPGTCHGGADGTLRLNAEQLRKFTISLAQTLPVQGSSRKPMFGQKTVRAGKWGELTQITPALSPQIVRLLTLFEKYNCHFKFNLASCCQPSCLFLMGCHVSTFTYFIVCRWWFKGDLRWSCIILVNNYLSLFLGHNLYLTSILAHVFGNTDHGHVYYIFKDSQMVERS